MPPKLVVQTVDMDEAMRKEAEKTILAAFEEYNSEEKIASTIKKTFDKNYKDNWNVIVGKNFGGHVINQTKCYMFASLNNDEVSVLLWKS